jgi:hypothetical protein
MSTPVPSIIGEPFDAYVEKQIKLRQNRLGAFQKNNQILTYETGKNPWIRLCSSVDISKVIAGGFNSKYSEGNIPSGNSLAQFYMLYGGVNMGNFGATPGKLKGGILDNNYSKTYVSPKAYGFDSSAEYGFSPMPGITSIDVVSQNQGSLREATIKITCYNISQFETIELLFLRLKYTILLEWGHSMYFQNDTDNLVTNPINDLYTKFLDPYKLSPDNPNDTNLQKLLSLVETERKNSSGNYDAFLGWVTNYEWEIQPGGIYNITIKAMSHGDIIESLSITTPRPDENGGDEVTKQTLVGNSILGKTLNALKTALDGDDWFTSETESFPPSTTTLALGDLTYFDNSEILSTTNIKNLLKFNITPYVNTKYRVAFKEAVRISPINNGDDQYYIKLGALLRIIEGFCLKYDNGKPVFSINWDYVENFSTSYNPNIHSNDLRICYAFANLSVDNITDIARTSDLSINDLVDANLKRINYMHILVNIDYIITTLAENIDTSGNLSIYDFLSSLTTAINGAMSEFVSLTPYHDYETNTLYIVDKSAPIKSKSDSKPPTLINVGILKPDEGTFVSQFSLKTEISPNLASQISIGAQANNADVGIESVAFSRWNEGLTDRIVPNKVITADPVLDQEEKDKYEGLEKDALLYLRKLRAGTWDEDFYNLGPSVKDYYNQQRAKELQDNPKIPAPNFIPISLNLTLDGISGVKIFQKYTISEDYLPKNYRDNIHFLIKGVSHTIDSSGWTTKLESLSVPVGDESYAGLESDFSRGTTPPPNNNGGGGVNDELPVSKATPSSKTLEQILIGAGYPKGTFKYELAYQIGKKEGFKINSTNRPSRNNNPGNLVFAQQYKTIDFNVILEPRNSKGERRFAKFSTPELGAKALVESKIVLWANGGYPSTIVNGPSDKAKTYRATYKVPSSLNNIAGKKVQLTLEQFMYIYAPPSENNTENYINNLIKSLKPRYPNFTRFSKIIDFLNK